MFKGHSIRRILALCLMLAIGWPESALALRPMTGQGAGVEELGRELAVPSAPVSGQLNTFSGHSAEVLDLAVSRDGSMVASSGREGFVYLWDFDSGRLIRVLRSPNGQQSSPVLQVTFDPDGKRLASLDEHGSVTVWDAVSGTVLDRQHSSFTVHSIHFLKNGMLVALTSDPGSVRLWNLSDATSSRELHRFTPGEPEIRLDRTMVSPDGRWVSWSSGESVWLQNVESGKLNKATAAARPIRTMVFSPDSKILLLGGEGSSSILALDTSSSPPVRSLWKVEGSDVHAIAFIPGRYRIAVADGKGVIRVPGEARWNVLPPNGKVNKLEFSPDGLTLLSASTERVVTVWGPEWSQIKNRVLASPSGASSSRDPWIRLVGLYGGSEAVSILSGLISAQPAAPSDELLVAVLRAAIHPVRPSPLDSLQWNELLKGLTARLKSSEPVSLDFLSRMERLWLQVLRLEGNPLDSSVFRDSGEGLLRTFGQGDAGRALADGNPKNYLAHLILSVSLRRRLADHPVEASTLAEFFQQRVFSDQEIDRLYDLWHRYPRLIEALFLSAVRRMASRQKTEYAALYQQGFRNWLIRASVLQLGLETLGFGNTLEQEFSHLREESSSKLFQQSARRLEEKIVESAGTILGVSFKPDRPVPFLDSEHFSEVERRHFINALIYQAEHGGASLRALLGAYFLALQKNPEDPRFASDAAQAEILQRTAQSPPPLLLEGFPGRRYYVVHSSVSEEERLKAVSQKWEGLRRFLRREKDSEALAGPPRDEIEQILGGWPEDPVSVLAVRELESRIRSRTERAIQTATVNEIRSFQQKLRIVIGTVISTLIAHQQEAAPKLVRILRQDNPVEALHFSTPSPLCFDCLTGVQRDKTQFFLTNPFHQVLVATDQENPEQEPPPARLTIAQTAEGAMIATNPLVGNSGFDFLPSFLAYLEDYAGWLQEPILLPLKFFPDQPGENWKRVREQVTLLPGADSAFHFDLAPISQLPATLNNLEVWRYDPPASKTLERAGFTAGQMNVLLWAMDHFLYASTEAQVEASFLRAVVGLLGYSGVSLYWVHPETGEIKSRIRQLRGVTRSQEWILPSWEQAEAVRRFQQGEPMFHIPNRFDPTNAGFVDQARLSEDQRQYPQGNVAEVFYLPLRDEQRKLWGILMVNNWEILEPLFSAHSKEEVRDLLEALGTATLMALERVRVESHLKSFLRLQEVGRSVASQLSDIVNDSAWISRRLARWKQSNAQLDDLASQLEEVAAALRKDGMEVLKASARRIRSVNPKMRQGQVSPISEAAAARLLVTQISLAFMQAVKDGNSDAVDRIEEEYQARDAFSASPSAAKTLAEWAALARQAIEFQALIRRENEELLPKVLEIQQHASILAGLQGDAEAILEGNGLPLDVRERVEATLRLVKSAISGIAQLQTDLFTAGMEEDENGGAAQPAMRFMPMDESNVSRTFDELDTAHLGRISNAVRSRLRPGERIPLKTLFIGPGNGLELFGLWSVFKEQVDFDFHVLSYDYEDLFVKNSDELLQLAAKKGITASREEAEEFLQLANQNRDWHTDVQNGFGPAEDLKFDLIVVGLEVMGWIMTEPQTQSPDVLVRFKEHLVPGGEYFADMGFQFLVRGGTREFFESLGRDEYFVWGLGSKSQFLSDRSPIELPIRDWPVLHVVNRDPSNTIVPLKKVSTYVWSDTRSEPPASGLEEPRVTRFFYHPALLPPNYAGVEEIPIPVDPVQARRFLLEAKLKQQELVLLPGSIAAGSEEKFRPVEIPGPIIVIDPLLAPELSFPDLMMLERLAAGLEGQVLRVGLEEWDDTIRKAGAYLESQY